MDGRVKKKRRREVNFRVGGGGSVGRYGLQRDTHNDITDRQVKKDVEKGEEGRSAESSCVLS